MMKKIKNIQEAIGEYIWQHWSAMVLTVIMMDMGLVNPFVVDKFQSIYKYPVNTTAALVWDGVFMLIGIVVIVVHIIIKKAGWYDD